AEAEVQVNGSPTPEAYEAINQVRRRGHGLAIHVENPAVDLQGLDAISFMDELKDERARELGFEALRKDDIIRWGEFLPRMKFVYQHVAGEVGTQDVLVRAKEYYNNAAARDVLWPIP